MKSDVHLTRREFLRASALTAGAFATIAPNLHAGEIPLSAMPVIDTHIHLYDTARPGGIPWPPVNDALLYSPHLPEDFEALTGSLGVVGTVVVEGNAGPEDNQWVLDQAKEHPIIVGYIGRLMPGTPEFAEHFDRYVGNPIFRGLRLSHPMLAQGLGQPGFDADIQRLAECQLTLDLVGGEAVLADALRIAKMLPRLRIVVDHLPFQEWDRSPAALPAALQEVAQLPNVYGKVSHVARKVDGRLVADPGYYRQRLDSLWELFGNERLLYGSNWPVSDQIAPYTETLKIMTNYLRSRDPSTAAKYFWKNSVAAYSWQPRGRAAGLLKI